MQLTLFLLIFFSLSDKISCLAAIQDRKIAHTVDYEQILSPGATITLPGYEGMNQGNDKAYKKKKNKKRTNKGDQEGTRESTKAEKRPRK